MNPTCIQCRGKPAKHPIHDPTFCTLDCGMTYGYDQCAAKWCPRHAVWHDDEGCLECRLEGLKVVRL